MWLKNHTYGKFLDKYMENYKDIKWCLQEEEFYLYALYNKNKPKSDALMEESGSSYFRVRKDLLYWT